MAIKDVIRRKRKTLGITQQVLANKIGVHRITITNFENGKHSLSSEYIDKICHILSIKCE